MTTEYPSPYQQIRQNAGAATLIGRLAEAAHQAAEAKIRAELITKVRDALWDEFERQHEADGPFAPCVGRDSELIDGHIDMDAAAAAAVDALADYYRALLR